MAAAAWMPSRLARALVESRHSRGQMPRPLFSAWLFAELRCEGPSGGARAGGVRAGCALARRGGIGPRPRRHRCAQVRGVGEGWIGNGGG